MVVPGAHYRAGWLHRLLMGHTHRELWATPIRVPTLDLAGFADGLTAYEKGGGKQSRSLRLRAGDGRSFVFRALDKDPTQTWPEALRRSPARGFAEDQISSIFPAGALAISVLEDSAGLLHARPTLVRLSDDPRLGQWREEFRGNVGVLEQRFRSSGDDIRVMIGASDVVSSETLFQRLQADNRNQVDQPRYLAARLFDLFVADWDRHADQWSWARFDGGEGEMIRWVPVPRDRDWALSRLDGPFSALLRLYAPMYQSFGPSMGSVYGLTWSAQPLDRRLLSGLDRAVWDSVAGDLVVRLSDHAIDVAASALPPEYRGKAIDRLVSALRHRRDELPNAAQRFYHLLSGAVEIRGSDRDEVAELSRDGDGLMVRVRRAGTATTIFRRRFDPRDTDEVRLYLFAGADTVLGSEGRSGPIRVRVAPDSAPNSPLVMPRDWGSDITVGTWLEVRPDVGLLIGGGPVYYRFGFRRMPWQSRIALRAAYVTGAPGVNLDLDADFRFENARRSLLLNAQALTVDVVRYFGIGNQTPNISPSAYHDVRQQQYVVEPAVRFLLGRHGSLTMGPFFRYSHTDLARPTKLAADRPYGSGEFGEIGVTGSLGYDSRNHPTWPTRGIEARLIGRLVPSALDADGSFGSIRLETAGFRTAAGLPAHPTLALRAAATMLSGHYPFFEAASIGGRGSVRGLHSHRFLGDREVNGSAELRLDLGQFRILAPGEWGVYGLGDLGRVFLEGESSDRWHAAAGGGLWFAFIDRRTTMTVTYATSAERAHLYVQAGFHF